MNKSNNNKRNNNFPPSRNRRKVSSRQQGKKRVSSLNPNLLIKKSVATKEVEAAKTRNFDALPLDSRLLQNLRKKGFSQLTEIQDQSIEASISGRNILGIANTGTGKTGAFLIPIIQRLLTAGVPFQTLILVPTRELALQVQEECNSMTKGLGIYCISLIGGTSLNKDMHRLRRMNQIVVGTPGRVTDLMNRGALRLKPFKTLVLDEFDRMLEMGFVNEVMRVTKEMKNRKQTILFSATENKKQRPLIEELLFSPLEVRISSGKTSTETVDQDIVKINDGEDKFDVLLNMVQQDSYEKVLVFAETKRSVSRIALKLKKSGVNADEIHGNKSQAYRKKALDKFRIGNARVLVATDVAARGIDVDDVTHVINYQLPLDMESYIHRIGRTGRAGKTGKAITLVD